METLAFLWLRSEHLDETLKAFVPLIWAADCASLGSGGVMVQCRAWSS